MRQFLDKSGMKRKEADELGRTTMTSTLLSVMYMSAPRSKRYSTTFGSSKQTANANGDSP